MTIPQAAIDIVKACEGCRLEAYYDSIGIPTIGYGSTKGVVMGMRITQAQAEELVVRDMSSAATSVLRLTNVPITDNQFAALIDFVYNLGSGAYQASTVRSRLNRYEYNDAANVILKYVYAGGKILNGLVKRRRIEYNLFMS